MVSQPASGPTRPKSPCYNNTLRQPPLRKSVKWTQSDKTQSVCHHDKTKMAETTIIKLATGIVHHESSHPPINIRSKGQGHRVTKCKNILKAIEWPAWVMHSIEYTASSSFTFSRNRHQIILTSIMLTHYYWSHKLLNNADMSIMSAYLQLVRTSNADAIHKCQQLKTTLFKSPNSSWQHRKKIQMSRHCNKFCTSCLIDV